MRARRTATRRAGGAAAALLLAAAAAVCPAAPRAPGPAAPPAGAVADAAGWVRWGQETYRLETGETFQFTVTFDQIPCRSWRLLVEGGQVLSDLLIRRLADGSLLYAGRNESRHDVPVPWGRGERISVALSPGRLGGGLYTVSFLGPPPDGLPASYSYRVNRALEAYAAGRREEASRQCERALVEDHGDGAACVLLAGFLRDAGKYGRAAGLAEQALGATDLTPEMRSLAESLRRDILDRAAAAGGAPAAAAPAGPGGGADALDPLDPRIKAVEGRLAAGDAAGALAAADSLLRDASSLPDRAQGRLLLRRGEALQALDRPFEALDAWTLALARTPAPRDQAQLHVRLGRLFVTMGNPAQARAAFALARRQGLPPELDAEAARALADLDRRKD